MTAARTARFEWTVPPSRIGDGVGSYARRLKAAVGELMDWFARRAESWAKADAPWTDRTGHARQGLTGRAFRRTGAIVLALAHTMAYGIWLEVRWGGKYAVILDTIAAIYPQVMAALGKLVKG